MLDWNLGSWMRPIYENCLVDFFRMKAGKQQNHIYYFHQLQCVSRHPEYFVPSKRLVVEKTCIGGNASDFFRYYGHFCRMLGTGKSIQTIFAN